MEELIPQPVLHWMKNLKPQIKVQWTLNKGMMYTYIPTSENITNQVDEYYWKQECLKDPEKKRH